MGDYAYLAVVGSDNPSEKYSREEILLAWKYSIPFLWFSIFDESSIGERTTEYSLYDVLFIVKEKGIQLAEKRKEYILSLFKQSIEEEYNQWLEILKKVNPGTYLLLDALDLRGSFGPDIDAKIIQYIQYWEEKDEAQLEKILTYSAILYDKSTHKAFFSPKMDKKYIPFMLKGTGLKKA